MKKTIIALSIVFVLAISGPAAAAGINFDGSLETEINWHRDLDGEVEVTPKSELELNFGLDQAEKSTRAVVEFGLEGESDNGLGVALTGEHLTLKKAYIETDGAFWHGGPEATTRFGNLNIAYSPYATVEGRSGISFSDMQVGDLNLNGFYGIPREEIIGDETIKVPSIHGMRADMTLEDLRLGSAIVRDENGMNIVVDADARPLDELVVGGAFTTVRQSTEEGEEAEFNYLWTVGSGYQAAENLSLYGGYRSVTEGWTPEHIVDENATEWFYEEGRKNKGLYVGMNTEQQGVNIHADYDQMMSQAALAANTEVEGYDLGVTTKLNVPAINEISTRSTEFDVAKVVPVNEDLSINASYSGLWEPGETENKLTHTLAADTKIEMIPAVSGLGLNGQISFAELNKDAIGYEVGAGFAAPNGINFEVEHVGGNSEDTGTTAIADITVKF